MNRGGWGRKRGDGKERGGLILLTLFPIEAEVGIFAIAVDFNFDESSGSVFGEEGVHRFEGPALPAGLGLRDLGAEAGSAKEVEVLGAHLIATSDLHKGSGDGKG